MTVTKSAKIELNDIELKALTFLIECAINDLNSNRYGVVGCAMNERDFLDFLIALLKEVK